VVGGRCGAGWGRDGREVPVLAGRGGQGPARAVRHPQPRRDRNTPPPSPLRRWLSLLLCLGRVESGGEGVSDGTPVMGVC